MDVNKAADPSPQASPEPRAAVRACDFEAESERLHIAICQAVAMLNNGDTLKGHTILREALAVEGCVTAPVGQPETNRQVHEAAAGMGLCDEFFKVSGIDPDAPAVALASPPQIAQPQLLSEVWQTLSDVCEFHDDPEYHLDVPAIRELMKQVWAAK